MSYRAILRTQGIRRIYAASIVGRLPWGFGSLATVLLVRDATGSFAYAGAAAGAELAAAGAMAPVLGRAVDRRGQRAVLVPFAFANAVAYCALALGAVFDSPGGGLVALAALVGVTFPPISACTRSLLASLLAGAQRETAYALEAVLQELTYTVGPLLVALAVALSGPAAALLVASGLVLAGTLWFAGAPASGAWRGAAVDRPRGGALGSPPVRTVLLYGALTGSAFGAVEVAATAFARAEGSPNAIGPILAIWAIGSLVGGLLYGARSWDSSMRRRLVMINILMVCAFGALALSPSIAAMAALIFACGLPIAPMAACVYSLLGALAPRGMLTETFT